MSDARPSRVSWLCVAALRWPTRGCPGRPCTDPRDIQATTTAGIAPGAGEGLFLSVVSFMSFISFKRQIAIGLAAYDNPVCP